MEQSTLFTKNKVTTTLVNQLVNSQKGVAEAYAKKMGFRGPNKVQQLRTLATKKVQKARRAVDQHMKSAEIYVRDLKNKFKEMLTLVSSKKKRAWAAFGDWAPHTGRLQLNEERVDEFIEKIAYNEKLDGQDGKDALEAAGWLDSDLCNNLSNPRAAGGFVADRDKRLLEFQKSQWKPGFKLWVRECCRAKWKALQVAIADLQKISSKRGRATMIFAESKKMLDKSGTGLQKMLKKKINEYAKSITEKDPNQLKPLSCKCAGTVEIVESIGHDNQPIKVPVDLYIWGRGVHDKDDARYKFHEWIPLVVAKGDDAGNFVPVIPGKDNIMEAAVKMPSREEEGRMQSMVQNCHVMIEKDSEHFKSTVESFTNWAQNEVKKRKEDTISPVSAVLGYNNPISLGVQTQQQHQHAGETVARVANESENAPAVMAAVAPGGDGGGGDMGGGRKRSRRRRKKRRRSPRRRRKKKRHNTRKRGGTLKHRRQKRNTRRKD